MSKVYLPDECCLCNYKLNKESYYVSYVHKDRPYGGYSKYSYPRHLCSQECLNEFEKNSRCNLCHIIIYDDALIKEGYDDYLYCNDKDICNLGNNTCYNLKFKKTKVKSNL